MVYPAVAARWRDTEESGRTGAAPGAPLALDQPRLCPHLQLRDGFTLNSWVFAVDFGIVDYTYHVSEACLLKLVMEVPPTTCL